MLSPLYFRTQRISLPSSILKTSLGIILAGWGAISEPATAASLYAITDLGTLGGEEIGIAGLNDAGQAVGYAGTSLDLRPTHAFVSQSGSMQDLGTLGGFLSNAADINNSGTIVGGSLNKDRLARGFVSQSGTMRELKTLGGPWSRADGINNAGIIVGASTPKDSLKEQAVLWSTPKAVPQGLGTLGGAVSFASKINDHNQVVGFSETPDSSRAFRWEAKSGMQDLGTLGGEASRAEDINNAGQIVGSAEIPNRSFHAFLWEDKQGMLDLGTLLSNEAFPYYADNQSQAWSINDSGQVVGSSSFPKEELDVSGIPYQSVVGHAFLYEDQVMQDLNHLIPSDSGWELNSSQAINDAGQIAGYGTIKGQTRGFLLTPQPVPEPASTLGILAFGIFGAAAVLRHKLKR
ncbi:MAG TPA: hypothetical protein V6D03_02820 [Candidatus Caenarcaniphilales bacterium]